jgi:hypothetical protein
MAAVASAAAITLVAQDRRADPSCIVIADTLARCPRPHADALR